MSPIPGIDLYNHFSSIKNFQCVTSNVFLEVFSKQTSTTTQLQHKAILLNLPLRAWSCFQSYKKRDYLKIAFDVSAIVSLFLFPNDGRKVAILIDLTSEIFPRLYSNVRFYLDNPKPTLNSKGKADVDYTVYENALEFLGLSETAVISREVLQEKYGRLTADYKLRVEKLDKLGSSLAETMGKLLEDARISYETVLKTLETEKKKS